MKRTIMVLGTVLAFLALSTPSRAADSKSSPLTGTWQCESHGGSRGQMSFALTLEQNGETVKGSVSSPMGDADISSGSFNGTNLRLEINTEQTNYILTAKYENGKLSGSWHTNAGEKGTWTGTKHAASGN